MRIFWLTNTNVSLILTEKYTFKFFFQLFNNKLKTFYVQLNIGIKCPNIIIICVLCV